MRDKTQKYQTEAKDFDDMLQAKIDSFLYGDKDFIYKNDIEKIWQEYLVVERTGE
jgi:salicylate hydroxylase